MGHGCLEDRGVVLLCDLWVKSACSVWKSSGGQAQSVLALEISVAVEDALGKAHFCSLEPEMR